MQTYWTKKGYLIVTAETAIALYSMGHGCTGTYAVGADDCCRLRNGTTLPGPGLYRMEMGGNGVRGWHVEPGKALDVAKTLADLDRRADNNHRARTGSPGIKGYAEAERASQGAIHARAMEAMGYARKIREHLAAK